MAGELPYVISLRCSNFALARKCCSTSIGLSDCDNLLFRRRAALEALEQRLLDANRTIGQPTKLTIIFGRRITRRHYGKLQSVIEDLNLPNPVLRSLWFVKIKLRVVCQTLGVFLGHRSAFSGA